MYQKYRRGRRKGRRLDGAKSTTIPTSPRATPANISRGIRAKAHDASDAGRQAPSRRAPPVPKIRHGVQTFRPPFKSLTPSQEETSPRIPIGKLNFLHIAPRSPKSTGPFSAKISADPQSSNRLGADWFSRCWGGGWGGPWRPRSNWWSTEAWAGMQDSPGAGKSPRQGDPGTVLVPHTDVVAEAQVAASAGVVP